MLSRCEYRFGSIKAVVLPLAKASEEGFINQKDADLELLLLPLNNRLEATFVNLKDDVVDLGDTAIRKAPGATLLAAEAAATCETSLTNDLVDCNDDPDESSILDTSNPDKEEQAEEEEEEVVVVLNSWPPTR